jgi:hypothetical protein
MLWGSTCRAVTSFRPYELDDRPSDAYICQPNAYTYRPIDQTTTDRTSLRTLAPYCYLNSPFWWILSDVYCEERNRLILRLVLCTGCEERPRLILSRTSFKERNYWDYWRWHHSATERLIASTVLLPLTTTVPLRIQSTRPNDRASTPTIQCGFG